MSHHPPVPDGAQSTYPLNTSGSASRNETRHELAEQAASTLAEHAAAAPPPASRSDPKPDTGHRGAKLAAGAAIGSAAIAAAVIFYNRSKA